MPALEKDKRGIHMRGRMKHLERVTAWVLLVVMGIQCFGDRVPSSANIVSATGYEQESEEAEEEIRAAEKTAGIEKADEQTVNKGSQEDTDSGKKQDTLEEEELNVMLDSESVLYEEKTISSDTTLTEDMEVGNLTVNGTLHLNGHRLVVHGDVKLNSKLHMEEGYLKVEGSFIEAYYANLYMSSSNDYIEVAGDYVFLNRYYYNRTMEKGTVVIGGNLYGADNNYCSTSVVFDSECRVILNGDHAQTIDIRSDSNFRIRNLVIDNTSAEGVFSPQMLNCDHITDEREKLHYKAEGSFGGTLAEDAVIEGDYCLLGGTLDLAGCNLTIRGNLIHAGGVILINGGSLTVEGDYKKQLCYTEDGEKITDYSTGRLTMQNEQDYVLIKGNYIDSGLNSTEGELTAGVMELQGSILADDNLKHALFYAKEAHQVKLTGAEKQVIKNGAKYTGDSIRFAHLCIDQPESGSTVLESMVSVTGSVKHASDNITGVTRLEGGQIAEGVLYGDVKIDSDYSFQSDVTIHGNVYWGKKDTKLAVDNCHVMVTGNLIDAKLTPVFTGEQALLTVKGDYILGIDSYTTFETGVIQIGGDIKKNGNASITFRENAELQFIGKSVQTVSASHSNTLLTNVVVDNPEGVVVEDNVAVENVSCKQGVLSYASGAVHGFVVEEDGEYEGDLVIGGGVFDLNGHRYHVTGNLTIANGALNMTNAADYLIVDGDFTTSSTIDHSKKLTAGTLEVKGNFTQKGGTKSWFFRIR